MNCPERQTVYMLNLLVFVSDMVVVSKFVNISKRENKEFSDNAYTSIYIFKCGLDNKKWEVIPGLWVMKLSPVGETY